MELGGNKNARAYYDQNGMIKDGKPDHESAPHARWKQELAARSDAAIKAEMPQVSDQQMVQKTQPGLPQQVPVPQTDLAAGLGVNPFDMSGAQASNT